METVQKTTSFSFHDKKIPNKKPHPPPPLTYIF